MAGHHGPLLCLTEPGEVLVLHGFQFRRRNERGGIVGIPGIDGVGMVKGTQHLRLHGGIHQSVTPRIIDPELPSLPRLVFTSTTPLALCAVYGGGRHLSTRNSSHFRRVENVKVLLAHFKTVDDIQGRGIFGPGSRFSEGSFRPDPDPG